MEITLVDQKVGMCKMEIKNTTGRTVYAGSFDCKEKSTKVSVATYTAGIYTVTVTINSQFIKSTKLSIVR